MTIGPINDSNYINPSNPQQPTVAEAGSLHVIGEALNKQLSQTPILPTESSSNLVSSKNVALPTQAQLYKAQDELQIFQRLSDDYYGRGKPPSDYDTPKIPLPEELQGEKTDEDKINYLLDNPGCLKDWITNNETLNNKTDINLWGLGLREFPSDLSECFPNLKQIDLQRNKLTQLPEGFAKNWDHLENVSLKHNQLQQLPEGVFNNCQDLLILECQYNQLKELPHDFLSSPNSFPHLFKVYFYDNQLKELPDDFLDGCPDLELLDFGNNQLTHLPEHFLSHRLSWLQDVDFRNNQLTKIPDVFLKDCPELHGLTLMTGNQIGSLPDEFLANLSSQKYLHADFELKNSSLSSLLSSSLSSPPKVKKILMFMLVLFSIPK